jgi:hypothetical protein
LSLFFDISSLIVWWWWFKVWSFLSSCQQSRILYRYRFSILVSKVWLKKQKRQPNRYHCRLLFYRACYTLFYHLYLFFICFFLQHCCSHNLPLVLSMFPHFHTNQQRISTSGLFYQYSQKWTRKNWDFYINVCICFSNS